jgi:hypothetical protein
MPSLEKMREQGMPGARCTRGLVCNVHKEHAHEHTGSAEASGIPCAMVLRLMPCSPRRRIRLVTVAAGLMALRSGRIDVATDSLTPATGARTTRFCRTQQPVFAKRLNRALASFIWRAMIAHKLAPALRSRARRRCRVHRIPARVRDDRDTPLLPGKDGASW